jgi:HSP20 family protein
MPLEKIMTLLIHRPGELRNLSRLLDLATGDWPFGSGSTWTPVRRPATDIYESDAAVQVQVELPGLAPSEVQLTLENDTLTIRGEKKSSADGAAGGVHRVERSHGVFERSFVLPESVNGEQVSASLENGVLTVTLPKAEKAKARTIEVKVGR